MYYNNIFQSFAPGYWCYEHVSRIQQLLFQENTIISIGFKEKKTTTDITFFSKYLYNYLMSDWSHCRCFIHCWENATSRRIKGTLPPWPYGDHHIQNCQSHCEKEGCSQFSVYHFLQMRLLRLWIYLCASCHHVINKRAHQLRLPEIKEIKIRFVIL